MTATCVLLSSSFLAQDAATTSDWLSSYGFLLLGFLALAAGPLLVYLLRAHRSSTVALDSFCLITISGFALLHLLPESAEQAGWLVLPLALAGFVLPSVAERTLHHGHPGMRRTVIVLALFGIAAHATLDGLFLNAGAHAHDGHSHPHTHELTAWAVILHRIPEGLGIWWIVPRTLGVWAAVMITLASVAATLFGYFVGGQVLTENSQNALAMLQSLLVGSLLHVVLHAHIPAPRSERLLKPASVLGAAIGVAVLWFVIHDHFPAHEHGGPGEIFVRLAIESAPALLIAYLLVGLCHAFLPDNWLSGLGRGNRLSQALRGVAIGLPLPVCSCGVVPIYRQLVRSGATIAAAIGFLVATPELELAAVTLTWQLMGAEVALVRVAMAALLALGVGVLVASVTRRAASATADPASQVPNETGDEAEDCCASEAEAANAPLPQRLWSAVRFGYGPAVDSTATWILTGLLLSAMLMPYVERDWLAALPPFVDVPVAALIGLPLYVCATGSTPLAAMLLVQGLSPGAVLALLLTGPATNITTFGVLAKLHGRRTAIVFAASMWLGAVLLGYLVNWLLDLPLPTAFGSGSGSHEHGSGSWSSWIWLWALAGVFFWSLLRQGVRPFLERLFESPANLMGGSSDGHGHGHGHDHGHDHPDDPPSPSCCGSQSAAPSPKSPQA
ncbi:MAG: permease [Planctomycetota bacterium]